MSVQISLPQILNDLEYRKLEKRNIYIYIYNHQIFVVVMYYTCYSIALHYILRRNTKDMDCETAYNQPFLIFMLGI